MKIIRNKSLTKPTRRIALFGGSFNPPHIGHITMARKLVRIKWIDAVWIVPVFRHPMGKRLAPFPDRLKMCRLAFGPISKKVSIRRLEEKIAGQSYTIKTIKILRKRYPKTEFLLVLGSDSYRDRSKWKRFDKIERLVGLIIFRRGPRSEIPNASSTKIRVTSNA